jgi:hypothetical protein
MTHYRMNDNTVSAIVLSKNKRTGSFDESRKYHNNTIFMDDGTEFSISLFNPTTRKVGVKIGINKEYSISYLVLNPGESVNLERFIDTNKKMIFQTYTVDGNNEQVSKAIINNGIVEILFYYEKIHQCYGSSFTFTTTNSCCDYTTLTNKSEKRCCSPSNSIQESNKTIIGTDSLRCDCTSDSIYMNQVNSLYFSPTFDDHINEKNIIETGRIEKGEKSSQNFKNIDVEFENIPFNTITYIIKPTSTKSDYETEFREYCNQCGYRIKKKTYLYCPKCGNKL